MKDLTMYHGTNESFDNFEINESTHEHYGEGIFFSTCEDVSRYYGDIVLEREIKESDIRVTIDCEGRGIKHYEDEVREEMRKGGIIEVTNVFDSEIQGSQCKDFEVTEEGDHEYKYKTIEENKFFVNPMEVSKNKYNKIKEKVEEMGITVFVGKKSVELYPSERITTSEVKGHQELGFKVFHQYCRTPQVQTTIIVCKDVLEKINN